MMQEGIFYQEGVTPGKHWGMLFLRINASTAIDKVYQQLIALKAVYANLQTGAISDLPGIRLPLPQTGLQVTIGYGKNIFSRDGIRQALPADVSQSNFRSPLATGGGKLLNASGLSYDLSVSKNPATEDIAIQFICDSELIIYRCYIETYKFLSRQAEPAFQVVKFYTGFQREDRRSWIDFHDGISNMKSGNERLSAIEIKDNNTASESWTFGGSYLAFIRIQVDLDIWLSLERKDQELLVGRDKISGCAFESAPGGTPSPIAGCPFSGTKTIVDTDGDGHYVNSVFFETPVSNDPGILASHIQRANHHRGPASQRDSLRIFRQGYEFFETDDSNLKPKVGLNFVSFQDTPERLIRMLGQDTWLGNVNFGGPDASQGPQNSFLKIWAAGIYIVPPANDHTKLPGFELFE